MTVGDQRWARGAGARQLRGAIIGGVFGPLIAGHARVRVTGREPLDAIDGPVVLVANHASHVDTPLLLGALAPARRRMTLVGAAADYFFERRDLAMAVALTFGAVPIHRRAADGEGGSLDALERRLREGFSLVLYAEGTRSRTGRLGELRPGAAALARRCGAPLVPVAISGTAELMGPGHGWMIRADPADRRVRHAVEVTFGAPLRPRTGEDVRHTMEAIRGFMAVAEVG